MTLVPDNYPVILPSGESTLSDKVKPEDLEVKTVEEPITISLVPSNYPVVLPSGVSTLSDQVTPEDLVINILLVTVSKKKKKFHNLILCLCENIRNLRRHQRSQSL